MTVYLVIQTGVYRHNIIGAYDTIDLAKDAAEKAATKERDNYHDFCVIETMLNAGGEKTVARLAIPNSPKGPAWIHPDKRSREWRSD